MLRRGVVVSLSALALLFTGLAGDARSTETAERAASESVVEISTASKAGQLRIVLRGDRFGRKAKVSIRGTKGKAKGYSRVTTVKKRKTLKRLKPGRYQLRGKSVRKRGGLARFKPKRQTVLVRKQARSKVALRYQTAKLPHPRSGRVDLTSTNANGVSANADVTDPQVSPVGDKVLFVSKASNLVQGKGNGKTQVFLKDLGSGSVRLVSASQSGQPGDADSWHPRWSKDGARVLFQSKDPALAAPIKGGSAPTTYIHQRGSGANRALMHGIREPAWNYDETALLSVVVRDGATRVLTNGYRPFNIPFDFDGVQPSPTDAHVLIRQTQSSLHAPLSFYLHDATGGTVQSWPFIGDWPEPVSTSGAMSQWRADGSIVYRKVTQGHSGDPDTPRTDSYELLQPASGQRKLLRPKRSVGVMEDGGFDSSGSSLAVQVDSGASGPSYHQLGAWDLNTGRVQEWSRAKNGAWANAPSYGPQWLPDGSMLFQSSATNLVGSQTNGVSQIFRKSPK